MKTSLQYLTVKFCKLFQKFFCLVIQINVALAENNIVIDRIQWKSINLIMVSLIINKGAIPLYFELEGSYQ